MSNEVREVIPVVPYHDIRAGHDFLVDVLGFASGGVVEDGNGVVIHAEVCSHERRIWLHAVAGGLTTPQDSGVSTGGIVVYVDDVDAHFERARDRATDTGATILREPTDEEYGQREYGLRDPEGHNWYIATPFATTD